MYSGPGRGGAIHSLRTARGVGAHPHESYRRLDRAGAWACWHKSRSIPVVVSADARRPGVAWSHKTACTFSLPSYLIRRTRWYPLQVSPKGFALDDLNRVVPSSIGNDVQLPAWRRVTSDFALLFLSQTYLHARKRPIALALKDRGDDGFKCIHWRGS